MSERSGGISLGTIIFWIFLANMFGFCDGEDKKTEVVVEDKPSVTTEVRKSIDELKPELERAAMEAKKVFEDVKEEAIKAFDEKKTKKESIDVYSEEVVESDDKYGSSDSLY